MVRPRILAGIVLASATVLLLVAMGLAALVLLINPDAYREPLARAFEAQTGRTLDIDEDFRLVFFPWIGVETGRIRVGSTAEFGPEPLAEAERAGVRVRLLPLLRRQVEVDTLELDGLVVRLARRDDGQTSWGGPAGASGANRPSPAGEAAVALPAALSIGALRVRGGRIEWQDAVGGREVVLSELEITSGRLREGEPLDFLAEFHLTSRDLGAARGGAASIEGPVALEARLTPTLAAGRVDAARIQAVARLEGSRVPGGSVSLEASARGGLDLRSDTLVLDPVTATAWNVVASGDLRLESLRSAPEASGRIEFGEFDVRILLEALGAEPFRTADPGVLTSASAAARFELGAGTLKLALLDARLDTSRLDGRVSVHLAEPPHVGFALALDEMDLDRYLPAAGAPPAGSIAAAPAAAAMLPVSTLRALSLDGSLTAGRLNATGLRLENLRISARADKGVIQLEPISAAAYGGRLEARFHTDARPAEPVVEFWSRLTGIGAGPLLRDLVGRDPVRGTADLEFELQTRGDSIDRLLSDLQGKGEFRLRDGAIRGFNAPHLLRQARAALDGSDPGREPIRETDLTELEGRFVVRDGILRNDDLQGHSPWLRLSGSGEADLVAETLDYRIRLRPVASATGQGGTGLEELRGIDIPLRIHGAWDDLQHGIDTPRIGELLGGSLRRELERRTGIRTDEAQEALRDHLRKLLR